MVTLSSAIENNVADENTVFDSPGSIDIGGGKVTNFDGTNYGKQTLAQATAMSSNTVFGQLGVQIGAKTLVKTADGFGFDTQINFDLPTAMSLMTNPSDMSEWELAWAAAGQPVGNHSQLGPYTSVLQMALVGCGIANDGTIMNPYLVQSVYSSNGERSYNATPSTFGQPISKSTANRVKEVLKGVVKNGTGTAAQIYGVDVAGKTGTAETGKAKDDSWFVGMAPADDPKLVIAIVLEESDEGTGAAKAKQVLTTALQTEGLL